MRTSPAMLLTLLVLLLVALGTICRLRAWRRELENTRNHINEKVKACHQETIANLAGLERHLEAIDHIVCMSSEFKVKSRRRHERLNRRIERIERIRDGLA